MTTVAPKPIVTRPWPVRPQVKGSAIARILRTTDAKQIVFLTTCSNCMGTSAEFRSLLA